MSADVVAAHERLCARYPRYARVVQLREWQTRDGGVLHYLAFKDTLSMRQVDWLTMQVAAEMAKG